MAKRFVNKRTRNRFRRIDYLYVEVTGEGPEGFVLDIKKQTENVTNDNYFVLKKETD